MKLVVLGLAAFLQLLVSVVAADVHQDTTTTTTTCPNEDKIDKPFAGLTLNILGRSFGNSYFMSKVEEWEEMTGAIVNVPVAATSGTELNELTEEDLSTGANFYDGYIATNQNVPTLASKIDPETKKPWLMELDSLVKNSAVLDWPGIDVIFREYLCLYDNSIYTLPFDGDQFLLFYRRDLQEQDGWEVPKTWDELVNVAEQYQGKDLDGDGVEDYAICQPNQGDMAFYSLYAPLLGLMQTHHGDHEDVKSKIFPKRHGVFLNLTDDGMEPLVDNAAMRRTMSLMKKIHDLGQNEDLDLCCSTKEEGAEKNSGHGLFRTGKCAFYFSFPSVGTNSIVKTDERDEVTNETQYVYQHGRMGTAPLPGWTEYLDRETDTLEPCTKEECPTSTELSDDGSMLNTASWFANGGMGAVVNGRVSELKQRAVFNLFAFFSKDLTTTAAGMPYNPFRNPKHFQLDEYLEAGWDEIDAELYLEAIQESLEKQNAVMDLRVPYALQSSEDKRGFFRAYVHQFNQFYNRTLNDEEGDDNAIMEDIIRDLHNEIQEWITIHDVKVESSDYYWTGEIEAIYRRSMSLPLRAEPQEKNEVPVAVAISVLSVGAVLIIASGVYVMKTRRHNILKAIAGLFNPIAIAFFELTMIIFDVSGDVLAFVLVIRKDPNVGVGFKLTYGAIVALALGASVIAITVGVVRIRTELGLFKKSARAEKLERKRRKEGQGSSKKTINESNPSLDVPDDVSDLNATNKSQVSFRDLDESDQDIHIPEYDAEEEKEEEKEEEIVVEVDDNFEKLKEEEEKDLEVANNQDQIIMEEEPEEQMESPSASTDRRRRMYKKSESSNSLKSFASNVWLKTKESIRLRGGEPTQLEFAEAFVNMLLLIFEDLPMAIMNIVFIMKVSGGSTTFTPLYMLSFAGGLILLGYKMSKLRDIEAFEDSTDKVLTLLAFKR